MPIIQTKIPYTPELSKNRKTGFARGHYFTRKPHKDAIESLRQIIWGLSQGKKWKKDKVWLEIYFQKDRMNSDVANYVDACADAVKEAIGVDDRYFSI